MRRIYGIAIAVIPIAVTVFVFYLYSMIAAPASAVMNSRDIAIRRVNGGPAAVMAEVAITKAEQARGLGGRESLDPDSGMLFPFSAYSRPGFWMKGMHFPLDIVYLNRGKVVEIKDNVPVADKPVPFFPEHDVNAVLEVNAGWCAAHGVKVGDPVAYQLSEF